MSDPRGIPGLLNADEDERRAIGAARGLLSEGRPIQLYNPNPNAPSSFGGASELPTDGALSLLARAMAGPSPPPIGALWSALPPQARQSYSSLVNVLAELSPGAAIRDSVDAYKSTVSNAMEGNTWDALGSGANLLTAMAGVLPGMRIAGSAHRADNILRRPEFAKMTDDQATAAVNALADTGVRWPSKNPVSSGHQLQTQAHTLYPDAVAAPPGLDQARAAGRESHNTFMTDRAREGAARAAATETALAADNRYLQSHGLPANPWDMPHGEQARALESLLASKGVPFGRTSGVEGSRYFEIPTGPGADAPSIKVRFSDHANTSRMFGNPDFNVTTDGGGNFEAGSHDLAQVLRALKGWGF